jgi:hypothetical protein
VFTDPCCDVGVQHLERAHLIRQIVRTLRQPPPRLAGDLPTRRRRHHRASACHVWSQLAPAHAFDASSTLKPRLCEAAGARAHARVRRNGAAACIGADHLEPCTGRHGRVRESPRVPHRGEERCGTKHPATPTTCVTTCVASAPLTGNRGRRHPSPPARSEALEQPLGDGQHLSPAARVRPSHALPRERSPRLRYRTRLSLLSLSPTARVCSRAQRHRVATSQRAPWGIGAPAASVPQKRLCDDSTSRSRCSR